MFQFPTLNNAMQQPVKAEQRQQLAIDDSTAALVNLLSTVQSQSDNLQSTVHLSPHSNVCTFGTTDKCPSIRRVVKLGILNKQFSDQQIAQFIAQCADYKDLNADLQHCMQYHLKNEDKLAIAAMTEKYQSIFDFICNFNQNQPVKDLLFYHDRMDIIYHGMSIKTEPVTPCATLNIFDDVSSGSSSQSSSPASSNCNMNLSNLNAMNAAAIPPTINTALFTPAIPNNIHCQTTPTNVDQSTQNIPFQFQFQCVPVNPVPNICSQIPPQIKKENGGIKTKVIQKRASRKDNSEQKFKCQHCDKQYKHLCNLRSHQKVHTDEALVCPHCDKRFGRKANFKEHLRIHTGETPYECEFCQRKFKHHHSWRDHIRIHTGEKPYQCNVCSKRFKVGHNLTVHLRIHTGEKPYQCDVCNRCFRQKSALNSHKKRVHGKTKSKK